MILTTITNQPFAPKGSGVPRSSAWDTGKIHLTDVIRYIQNKLKLDKYRAIDWDLALAGELGFLWEDVMSYIFGQRMAVRIGEVERDGIVGSPDGIAVDGNGVLVDEEYKVTWRSSNRDLTTFWYWITQFKSYCTMLDTKSTIIRVFWVNGDYRGSGPQYGSYRADFDDTELRQNWDMIVSHSKEMVDLGFMDYQRYQKSLQGGN